MSQRLLEVRVRPIRLAILVNRKSSLKDFMLAVRLLSKIWGGRFGQLHAVDPDNCDELTAFRLGESRPEFVFGVGLDDQKWKEFVHKACQPRVYFRIDENFVTQLYQPNPHNPLYEHYSVSDALVHLIKTRDAQVKRHRKLRLISVAEDHFLSAYCGAMFGFHHPNLHENYRDEVLEFLPQSATEIVNLSTEFAKDRQQSWLDVTGHKLTPHLFGCAEPSPTIVIVGDPIVDLSLFWNLRSASDTDNPCWVIPLPNTSLAEPNILNALKDWLLAFSAYGKKPNFCLVTSETVTEETCQNFADKLLGSFVGTNIQAVDYEPPQNRLPVVIPIEYEATWEAEQIGQTLTLTPPKPKAFEPIRPIKSWVVDLRRDRKTGRAVGELQLPSNQVSYDLLNGPCPPRFDSTLVDRKGYGHDCISYLCSNEKEVMNLFLPTAEEVLHETLREFGVEPLSDEKRSSYLPVIKKFGGIHRAAVAFSETSGLVLKALASNAKTYDQIQSECRVGNGDITANSYIGRIETMVIRETDRVKRISRQRFMKHAQHTEPENLTLRSMLEFWADKEILTRLWQIGPCGHCRQQYFLPVLNIQKRIVCLHCGNKITLPTKVPLGYKLHQAVQHAVSEGIIPVVLTGRFLYNLSHFGFLWLPGVKYRRQNQLGDIDLLACCDGHLVFCECKQLSNTPPDAKVWTQVVNQFLETVEIAKLCGGSLVVLASQVIEYPPDVQKKINDAVQDSIPILLLTKSDLDKGYREIILADEPKKTLWLDDLIPIKFPEREKPTIKMSRTIDYGCMIYTHQIGDDQEK